MGVWIDVGAMLPGVVCGLLTIRATPAGDDWAWPELADLREVFKEDAEDDLAAEHRYAYLGAFPCAFGLHGRCIGHTAPSLDGHHLGVTPGRRRGA